MNSVKTTIAANQVHGSAECQSAHVDAGKRAGTSVVAAMGVTYSQRYRSGALKQPTKVFNTAVSTHMFIGVEGN